ncbi:MAG: TIGR01777 family oxidoreductase [Lautropia sp.]|nr:TIGR01777 family oxidoreductase [Lautropia sp.]
MTTPPVVVLLGGSGFIGSHLATDFHQQGWRVLIISRHPDRSRRRLGQRFEYFPSLQHIDPGLIVDLVINLAGASVGEGRWTPRRKRQLLDSRLGPTRQLAQWLHARPQKPRRLIQASAVGYYGNGSTQNWEDICDESAPPQADVFVSELCQQWETLARDIHADSGVAVSICRLGVVLGRDGGILPQLLKPVSMMMGRMGTGQQPLPWIHIDDVVGAIRFIAKQYIQPGLQVYNLTAPETTTQLQFAQTAARLIKRPLLLFVPASIMRLAMGEQAELVLDGQFVHPAALLNHDYDFRFPSIETALADLLPQR